MTVNFPSSPSQGDTYTYEAITYTFDGEKWVGSTASSFNDVTISGASANVILQGNDSITTDQTFTFNDQGGKLVPYQQGIWTPYYSLLDGSGAISNYDSQAGTFTRIGNQITAYFFCVTRSAAGGSWSYQNGASNATATIIGGLPYIQSAGNPVGSGFLTWGTQLGRTANSTPALTDITVWVSGGDSKLRLNKRFAQGDGTYGYANVEMADFILNSGAGFQGVATYVTADTTWTPINGATVS